MENLFDADSDISDNEESFRTNNEYARNYNDWRQKEEFNKLKTKYGEHSLQLNDVADESDSSSDDEDIEIPEKLEVDFFKTLSSLKTKDPKIYDANVKFFDDTPIVIKTKKRKVEQMFLKDYERKLLLEKGGIVSSDSDNEDNENSRSQSPTYIEEQRKLKENLRRVAENIEDDDENEWGGMFNVRSKTKEEKDIEESQYKQWLMGQKEHLNDANTEKNLQSLKQYWQDPKLDKSDKFLRDYILKNRFLEKTNPQHVPTYDEIVHDSDDNLSEDEANLTKQEQFEHKYNYRFEEPDQEFIKRYPRTMESSLRRTDDRRKLKRAEVKERKLREKQEKFEEIRKMKVLKRKEVEERIAKLREVTGNSKVAFEDVDLDADFDPESYDKRMNALFNSEFYHGEEGDQKPEFPDLDEELEIERWDKWEGNCRENEPHCEDEDFNMDCDNDRTSSRDKKSTQQELLENSQGGRKKRKRKSKFAKAVSRPKPSFDPSDKTYDEYLDEYYKLDCEDVIGDIPCRFKYRSVVPNNFGLTFDEILNANDRELNKWCSIKKAVQLRPDHIEKYDVIAYSHKANNEALKRKILPSLFDQQDNVEAEYIVKKKQIEEQTADKNNKKKGKKSLKGHDFKNMKQDQINTDEKANINTSEKPKKIEENAKSEGTNKTKQQIKLPIENKTEKKIKGVEKISIWNNSGKKGKLANKNQTEVARKTKKKGKIKKINSNTETDSALGISDARLKAFGIKPKKFKNKLKFGSHH